MASQVNYSESIIHYLQQFGKDGEFHDVENVLDGLEFSEKKAVLEDLKNKGIIQFTPGGFEVGALLRLWYKMSKPDDVWYQPFKATLLA